VRIRGNAPQVYDKYMTLARDATASGDRIAAESYYQFAEHYFRIMNDSTDPRRAAQQTPRSGREPLVEEQEQPQVDWPVQLDGADADSGKEAESEEAKVAEEPGPSDEEAPRRMARGRPRGRRRAANGANDPAEKSAAEVEKPGDGADAQNPEGGDSATP
jgi:hypothetical protein